MSELKTGTETRHCENHGSYEAVVTLIGSREMVQPCPICEANRQNKSNEVDAQKIEAANNAYIEKSLRALNVPKRYQPVTVSGFESQTDSQKIAKELCTKYVTGFMTAIEKGRSMILCGNVGTGKTHLAYAVAMAVVKKYQPVLRPIDNDYIMKVLPVNGYPAPVAKISNALDILRDVKSTYSKENDRSEREVIQDYVDCDLLVIDEIGVQFGTEADKIIIFDLINRRYQEMKPTIMISNLTHEELKEFIGERTVDRFLENGGAVLSFDWESHRSK